MQPNSEDRYECPEVRGFNVPISPPCFSSSDATRALHSWARRHTLRRHHLNEAVVTIGELFFFLPFEKAGANKICEQQQKSTSPCFCFLRHWRMRNGHSRGDAYSYIIFCGVCDSRSCIETGVSTPSPPLTPTPSKRKVNGIELTITCTWLNVSA